MRDLITDSLDLLSHADLGRLAADAERQAAELRAAGNEPAAMAADAIRLTAERALLLKTSGFRPD